MTVEKRVRDGEVIWTQKQVLELLESQRAEIVQGIREAVERDRGRVYRPKFQAGMESVIELVRNVG